MDSEHILDEIEEFQELIAEKMAMFQEYVDAESDIDSELEPAFDDLKLAVSNINDELDNFSSVIQ